MIENNINIAVHYHVILFSWNLWAMVRTLKVFVERKTFLVRLEGEHRGNWCLITEHSRGSVFVLGFEKDAVGWMIEHLTKAIEMKSHLGFNRKFRGKCCVHLMEVGFNNHIRFIRISEFATNRKSSFLIIPEGEKGRGWENIKSALSSMLVVPPSNAVEKGRQYRGERFSYNHVGPLHWSFAKVVSGEGPRGGGGKWVFFVETTEEALFFQDLRNLRVEGRNTVQMRRWSPKENSEIEGKFRGGWIELRGLPFHLWSEVHLKKIVERWETATEIDWRTLKLFNLSKARVRIAIKDKSILPALIEVTDGDWVFTVFVVVVGDEDGRRGSVKGESTREAFASYSRTGGERRGERVRSTVGGRHHVEEDSRMRKGGERGMTAFLSERHVVRVVRFHRCLVWIQIKRTMGLSELRKREELGPEGTRPLLLRVVGPTRGRPSHCLRLVQNMQKWAAIPKGRRGWA